MKVTKELLKQWKNIDIRDVEAKDLTQLKDIKINPRDSQEKRVSDYIKQTENPHFIAIDKCAFKLVGMDNGKSLEDCFIQYLNGF